MARKAAASPTKGRPRKVEKPKMEFDEGAKVLAKWPGTNLYFQAKVTYVRDDDNEYDVQYEDGTIFTIRAKDVQKRVEAKKKTPSRSRSRGRGPGRRSAKKATPNRTPSASATPRQSRAAKKPAVAAVMTPTRQSARIAAAKIELSSDESECKKAKAVLKQQAPGIKDRLMDLIFGISLEWLSVLFFTALSPFILISLHTLCTAKSCKPALPFDKLPKTFKAYWDAQAFMLAVGFLAVLRIASFLPIGRVVRSPAGVDVRANGFLTLLMLMAAIPALVYKKVNLAIVSDKYFHLMTSMMFFSVFAALIARFKAYFFPERKSNVNPKGNTGNPIVDICNGRELNMAFLGQDTKLVLFSMLMIAMAIFNVGLVINSIMAKDGAINPVVVVASSFQVLYALDAMFFEEYFFFSHDSMNSGVGLHLINTYLTFAFVPTMITQYLIHRNPVMKWYYLV